MKVENINSKQNFTALKRGISISDDLFSKISKTQVVKTFAKKYDAELNLDLYQVLVLRVMKALWPLPCLKLSQQMFLPE